MASVPLTHWRKKLLMDELTGLFSVALAAHQEGTRERREIATSLYAARALLRRFLKRHKTVGSALAEWPGLIVLARVTGLDWAPTRSRPTPDLDFDPASLETLTEKIVTLKVLNAVT